MASDDPHVIPAPTPVVKSGVSDLLAMIGGLGNVLISLVLIIGIFVLIRTGHCSMELGLTFIAASVLPMVMGNKMYQAQQENERRHRALVENNHKLSRHLQKQDRELRAIRTSRDTETGEGDVSSRGHS